MRRARATRPVDRPGSRRNHQSGPLPPESERIAARHGAFGATPIDHYPRAAAAAATLAGYISTQQHLWGLRRILDELIHETLTES